VSQPSTDPSPSAVVDHIADHWWREHLAALSGLVAVPSVSPAFESGWARSGALTAAVEFVAAWFSDRATTLPDVRTHHLRIAHRTPLLVVDIPAFVPTGAGAGAGEQSSSVLVYGHLDVQPAGDGWVTTDPFRPALRDTFLYGRGTGDDKYVPFAVVSAIEAMRSAGHAHPRVVLFLETSEESSSVDLPAHLAAHGDLLGEPGLIVCLDTFVPDSQALWHSSSMRGIVVADLTVAVATQGMHSGMVGGIAPSSFRLLRNLLDRVEDSASGSCLLPELRAKIPVHHREALLRQADHVATPSTGLPLLPGVSPQSGSAADQLIAQSWSPSFSYVGVDGMPPTNAAGSVLRESTTVRLSIRLPPTVPAATAADALRTTLESNPPSGALVRLDVHGAEDGWSTTISPEVRRLLDGASTAGYGARAAECGGGATVPPLAMLARRFPQAIVIPLGVVTPESNPHGPDENIDIRAAIRLSTSLAAILSDQTAR